ncbi:NAD(P)-dependent oxidoreductase, partial [Actinoplanes sp. NPDC051633]|uniref:NAD-dependent epimerase/dehydratase family protein n=1 Tax=Actinoplanes sp. NPDC051633 TaxID=3155670 RepID=UPI0034425EA0
AHLAAIADPDHEPATEIFVNNTTATFVVLWTAAEHGVRRFAIASSAHATGLSLNPHRPPVRYPITEDTPADIADPYSMAKQTDENTLRAVCRRFGASGVALRLPLVVPPDRHDEMRRWYQSELAVSAGGGFVWMDSRDAAEAFRLGLTVEYEGAHVLLVAAETTFADKPTAELLPADQPHFPGNAAPVDTSRARDFLGWAPEHPGVPSSEL